MDGAEQNTPASAATTSIQEVAKISDKSAHIRALLDQFINYNKTNKPVPIEIINAIFPTTTYPLGLPYPQKKGAHSNPKCLENEAVQIDFITKINQDNREGQFRILQIVKFLVVIDTVGLEDFHPAKTKEALIGILAQQQTVADTASAILDYCKKSSTATDHSSSWDDMVRNWGYESWHLKYGPLYSNPYIREIPQESQSNL